MSLKLLVLVAVLAQLARADDAKPAAPRELELCKGDNCQSSVCAEDECHLCLDGVCCKEDGCTACITRCRADCKYSKCAKNCFRYCRHMHGFSTACGLDTSGLNLCGFGLHGLGSTAGLINTGGLVGTGGLGSAGGLGYGRTHYGYVGHPSSGYLGDLFGHGCLSGC